MSQNHEHPSHRLAVVLGGGGAAGNAWLIGVVAGMADAGLDLTEADLVIGTSAGATAAAQIRGGTPVAALLSAITTPPSRTGSGRPAGPPPSTMPRLPREQVFDRMRAINAASASSLELQRAMGAFGLESDEVLAPGAAQWRATVAARFTPHEWPDRPTTITVVDAHTGELIGLDRDSGVDLVDAVAASTALPGMVATVRAGGRNLVDGGVRSAENAELAAGYANVVVLAPLAGSTPPPGRFEGLRRFPDTTLDGQVAALRASGSTVTVIMPDDDAQAAMGSEVTDLSTRAPSARAGFAQGGREAAHIVLI
jgi:NTE family protein